MMDLGAVAVLDIQRYICGAQDIAVSESDIFAFSAGGFETELAASAPIAPKYTVFYQDVFAVRMDVAVNAFDADRVVEGMYKGVFYGDILAVYNIDAVGIVAPLTENLDVIQHNAITVE
jgi:hypothetical protein